MRLRSSGARRRGLSLLEVILSLAIFLLSMVGLGYLMILGSDMANEAHVRTLCTQAAQTKLAEASAGSVPLQAAPRAPLEEGSDLEWEMQVDAGPSDSVKLVTVRVSRPWKADSRIEVGLSQLVFDPKAVGSTQDVPGADQPSTNQTTAGQSSAASSSPTGSSTPSAPSAGAGTRTGTGSGTGGKSGTTGTGSKR